jgi:hypothetical protein
MNNVAAATATFAYDQVIIAPESSAVRLVLRDGISNTRWVAAGKFQYASGKSALNHASGGIDSLTIFQGDTQLTSINFGRPFDVQQLLPLTAAQASAQFSYRLSFLSGDDSFFSARTGTASDQVQGLDGNDAFAGYGGVDTFDGGNGRDTVVYRGWAFEYTISPTANNRCTVRDNVGQRDDTDILINVERLQFSDFTVALDIGGTAGQAYRIYKAAFNRMPDLSGLGHWIYKMDTGTDLIAVSLEFIRSNEFRSLYGSNLTDGGFITRLYSNVLQRTPDDAGYRYCQNQITSKEKTWQKVLADFSESAENQANVAQLIASGIPYAPYDPPG